MIKDLPSHTLTLLLRDKSWLGVGSLSTSTALLLEKRLNNATKRLNKATRSLNKATKSWYCW